MESRLTATIITAFAMAGVGALAGDLDPAGVPAPTPGPEPRIAVNSENTPGDSSAFFIIRQPGSYYLEANLLSRDIMPTRDGIVIASSKVTLDLNGFTLDGSDLLIIPIEPGAPDQIAIAPTNGIRASGFVEGLSVTNGVVCDWTSTGLNLTSASDGMVAEVHALENGGTGISVGNNSTVRDCISRGNGGPGIAAQQRAIITDCLAADNESDGIRGFFNVLIRSCVASTNDGDGFSIDSGSVLDCYSHFNDADGIEVSFNSIVERNTTENNQNGAGIRVAGSNNRIVGNNCSVNEFGIQVSGDDNFIAQNSASRNSTDYSIDSGNGVGPILTNTDPITSINPWANFQDGN